MISQYLPQQEYVQTNFLALTDALLPPSDYNLGVHQYVIYGLNHYISIQKQLQKKAVPLAKPAAILLDIAATEFFNKQYHQQLKPENLLFARLFRKDRRQTLSALENLEVDLYLLPSPFQNNAGMIKHVIDALHRFTLFGYYSEWSAYGSTRLLPPQDRQLEYFPVTWQQVGYPGVSFGYRDFRGFLLKMEEVRE